MATLIIDSPLGQLRLTSRGGGLAAITWASGESEGRDDVLDAAAVQLDEYFQRRRTHFDVPLSPAGTAFQARVWTLMSSIPYGQTITYGAMAKHLGTAARAIGGACGRNPLPIIVPCHRVIGHQHAGGYSGQGGVQTKAWLLTHERGVHGDLFLPPPLHE